MATTAYAPTHAAAATSEPRPGIFSRMLGRMMMAREMEAKRRIAGYHSLMADEDLARIGLTRDEVRAWHHIRYS